MTSIWVSDLAHGAVRDVVRVRLAAIRALRQAFRQPPGLLLRRGRHCVRHAWTLMHRRWRSGRRIEEVIHHIALGELIEAFEAARSTDARSRDRRTGVVLGADGERVSGVAGHSPDERDDTGR